METAEKAMLMLMRNIRIKQKKYIKTRYGPLLDEINKLTAELDQRLDTYFQPRDPKQKMFEAQ